MYTKIANNVKDFLTDRKGEEICWMVSQVCRSKKKPPLPPRSGAVRNSLPSRRGYRQTGPAGPGTGAPIMKALSDRQSIRSFSEKALSQKDLSDLLWAANGINRQESGKRTAPSAMNRQDVKIYICTKKASYLYDHKAHAMIPVNDGDVRPADAPICLILVTDTAEPWAAMDAGIVSQNISLFCSGTGLATYPRASMNKDALAKALKLTSPQNTHALSSGRI